MYTISSYFIKGQIPGTSIHDLLNLYKQELESQSVSFVYIEDDVLYFSNKAFRVVPNRLANKFAAFDSGKLWIEDLGKEFIVRFEADNLRSFKTGSIIAGIITLLLLFTSNFDLYSLMIGFGIFCLIVAIGYGLSAITFPVYFNSIRNDIEQYLQNKTHL